jgi:hypothetical protein
MNGALVTPCHLARLSHARQPAYTVPPALVALGRLARLSRARQPAYTIAPASVTPLYLAQLSRARQPAYTVALDSVVPYCMVRLINLFFTPPTNSFLNIFCATKLSFGHKIKMEAAFMSCTYLK